MKRSFVAILLFASIPNTLEHFVAGCARSSAGKRFEFVAFNVPVGKSGGLSASTGPGDCFVNARQKEHR